MDDERKEEKPKIESKRKEMSSFVARKNEKRKCRVKMTGKEIAALRELEAQFLGHNFLLSPSFLN